MITYRYKLSPTKSQLTDFLRQLEVHKTLYNKCLEQRIESYKLTGKSPSRFDQQKTEVPKYKGLSNYSSMQCTVQRLDNSYKEFFKKNNSFPRFKSRFRTIKYSILSNGCQIKPTGLYLQYLGIVKLKWTRPIPDNCKIKTLSVTHKNGTLYVNFMCENLAKVSPKRTIMVGVDFGIKSTVTMSDGVQIQSPQFTKQAAKNIARLQRKKEKSKNKRKIKKALAKAHGKIQNKRADFNHKLSKCIVQTYDIICLEDIKVSELTSQHSNINKRMFDIGISQLKQMITYKAENAGKLVVLVNPAYTTQTCSSCGERHSLALTERKFICKCGLELDRDVNAAKNILRLGLQSFQDEILGRSP